MVVGACFSFWGSLCGAWVCMRQQTACFLTRLLWALSALPPAGAVVVAGAGSSGVQIADELNRAG